MSQVKNKQTKNEKKTWQTFQLKADDNEVKHFKLRAITRHLIPAREEALLSGNFIKLLLLKFCVSICRFKEKMYISWLGTHDRMILELSSFRL